MKKLFLSFLTILLLTIFQPKGFGQAIACDQNSKALIIAAYAGAMTRPDNFPNVTVNNSDMFASANQWEHCIDRISYTLRQGALSGPSTNEIRESAYNVANRANAPETAEALYQQIMQTRSDMIALARHFDSLSISIRAILDGDTSVYYNSEVYQMSTFTWRAMENAWGWRPGAVEMWRRLFYSMYLWYLDRLIQVI